MWNTLVCVYSAPEAGVILNHLSINKRMWKVPPQVHCQQLLMWTESRSYRRIRRDDRQLPQPWGGINIDHVILVAELINLHRPHLEHSCSYGLTVLLTWGDVCEKGKQKRRIQGLLHLNGISVTAEMHLRKDTRVTPGENLSKCP